MIYMLDTNICAYIIRERLPNVKERLKQVAEAGCEVSLSSIVVSELFYGAYRKGSSRILELIERFVENFKIYEFDLNAARRYGKLRADLEKEGEIIGPYDLQIAAHAMAIRAILVTNNEREFKRITGLKVENWAC